MDARGTSSGTSGESDSEDNGPVRECWVGDNLEASKKEKQATICTPKDLATGFSKSLDFHYSVCDLSCVTFHYCQSPTSCKDTWKGRE